jgi:hypothetical protein
MCQMRPTHLSPAIGIAVAIVVAACSGGATEAPASQTPTSAPAATAGPAAATPPGDGGASTAAPNPGGAALNTAVVTIGEERYEFSGVRCDILTVGYIQAGNYGGDPEVIIVLPPPGWESQGDTFSAPEVRVSVGSGIDEQVWYAGAEPPVVREIPDGSSSLEYNVPDGRPVTATGTGTFIDTQLVNFGKEWVGVPGSFEVTCP